MEATELTWADQIFSRGQAEGVVATLRDNIRQVLRSRFGAVPDAVEATLSGIEREEDLAALFHRSLDVPSVDDLL